MLRHIRQTAFFSLVLILALSGGARRALAWDQHHFITHQALLGYKFSDANMWQKIGTPVRVTPIEQFIIKAFGSDCSLSQMQDNVLEGVGMYYSVLYTPGADYSMSMDWDKGLSRVLLHPLSENTRTNPQAVGRIVMPLDVLTIYSDEPDWNMDDDVPRLKGKGVSGSVEGTATRLLRHFWYEGQETFGQHFDKDQETDRRMQIYYEMSLIAFSVDEPYWGYRFLANALHYLQDISQPFHVRAIITEDMIGELELARGFLCSLHNNNDCGPHEDLNSLVTKYAWIVGAYHSAYEDFARGLLAPSQRFGSLAWVSDYPGSHAPGTQAEGLTWRTPETYPLINATEVIRSAQRATMVQAEDVGKLVYKVFGWQMRYDQSVTEQQVLATGADDDFPYYVGTLFGFTDLGMQQRQLDATQPLVDLTHQAFQRAGSWSREFIKQTVTSADEPDVLAHIETIKKLFQKKCVAPLPSKRPGAILNKSR